MNFFKKIILGIIVICSLFIVNIVPVMAANDASQPAAKGSVFTLPSASLYGNNTVQATGSASVQFYQLVWGIVNNVRYIIGAIAIIIIIYAGLQMVMGQGNDAVYSKQRTMILYAAVGLAIVSLSGELAKILQVGCNPAQPGSCVEGGFLANPNAIIRSTTMFNQRAQIIITFLKYFIGSVAVAMMVRSGYRMISMGNTEDKLAVDKKNLIYGTFGLILIIVADNLVNNVFYKLDPTRYPSVGGAQPAVNAVKGVSELIGVTNMVVTIVAPLAILSFIVGAVFYITAMGKDDQVNKAKKIMTASIMGMIIIFGAYAIVNTFISGSFGNPESDSQTQVVNISSGTD